MSFLISLIVPPDGHTDAPESVPGFMLLPEDFGEDYSESEAEEEHF